MLFDGFESRSQTHINTLCFFYDVDLKWIKTEVTKDKHVKKTAALCVFSNMHIYVHIEHHLNTIAFWWFWAPWRAQIAKNK